MQDQPLKRMDPDIIRANALRASEEEVRHNFTPAEIAEMKDRLYVTSRSLYARGELAKTIKALLDTLPGADAMNEIHMAVEAAGEDLGEAGSKVLAVDHHTLLKKIRDGYEIRKVMVYEIEGENPGILEYYNEDGIFLWDRRVAGARQLNIISSLSKTGTTDEE